MARPQKDNAEYFSHDRDMRNDDRILALRSKHGIVGYAVWVMFLEILTGSDGFEIKLDDIRSEIVAGDMRVSAAEMHEILSFCSRIDLIQIENSIFSCKKLKNRLNPIIEKREFLRQKYQEKVVSTEKKGVSAPETPISANETTQSKVKESKVNKSKVINNIFNNTKIFFKLFSEIEIDIKKQKNEGIEMKKIKIDPNKISDLNEITESSLDFKELFRFYNYWVEKTKFGKMRWELEKTFELDRRIIKWKGPQKETFNNTANKPKGIGRLG